MCITFSSAKLSGTKLYAGEARHGDRYVHVIAYQNKAATEGPNAMILPIPAAVMPSSENVIDTRKFPLFLDDIHKATRVVDEDVLLHMSKGMGAKVQVFNVGSYTVVLAKRPQAVAGAITDVPAEKRPTLNPAVLRAFDELYPGWPLAVCCWAGTIEPEPLLWWYEPKTPQWLFAPSLDAHDGGPPDASAEVLVDHHIAFGSTLRPRGNEVHYSSQVPRSMRALLPPNVRGTRIVARMPNGDFWLSTRRLRGSALRCAPPREAPTKGAWAKLMDRFGRTCPAPPRVNIPLEGWRWP